MTEPITIIDLAEVAEAALQRLFIESNTAEVRDSFRAFPLDAEMASELRELDGQDQYFAAVRGEVPVGVAMLRGWDGGFDIPSFGVFVHPDHQGAGLGRRLLAASIERAAAAGARRLRLTVDTDNVNAVGLYRSAGFVADPDQSDSARLVMFYEVTSCP